MKRLVPLLRRFPGLVRVGIGAFGIEIDGELHIRAAAGGSGAGHLDETPPGSARGPLVIFLAG